MAVTTTFLSLCRLFSYRRGLAAVLVAAGVLRICLAFAGGQGWWPDEQRFNISVEAAQALLHGYPQIAFNLLGGHAYHIGAGFFFLPPALASALGVQPPLVALFFAAISLANIHLVARVARVMSGRDDVAFWTALVAASSNSLFYYSSHYFPYDASLCLILCGLWWGLHHPSDRGIGLSGVLVGLGFVLYNGYWLFSGVTLTLATLRGANNFRAVFRRVAWGIGGLLTPLATFVAVARWAGSDLVEAGITMSRQVVLGYFSEGWTFPFEYFLHSEGMLLILWILALAAVLAGGLWRAPGHLYAWAVAIVVVYLGLAAFSAVFEKFVIYARVVRCLAPLSALLCGGVLAEFRRWGRVGSWVQGVAAVAIIATAGVNLSVPLRQWYTEEYHRRAVTLAMTQPPSARLLALNVHNTPTLRFPEEYPIEEVLLSRPHPLQYSPFLYEGLTPAARRLHREGNFPMQVVRVRAVAPPWTPEHTVPATINHPGPLVVTLTLPSISGGRGDPLVATGFARGADWLTVVREEKNRFHFKYRHWGDPILASGSFELDETREHRLVVSLGSMLPPSATPGEDPSSDLGRLRRRLYVAIDDQVVFNQPQTFYACRANNIEVGRNSLDGTVTEPVWRGKILNVTPLPVSALISTLEASSVESGPIALWDGYPGPTRARLSPAVLAGGKPIVLAVSGRSGSEDSLRLVPLGPKRVQLEFVHDGAPVLVSPPMDLEPKETHEVVMSFGSLLPPASAAIYQQRPETAVLRHWLFAALDGRRVFSRDHVVHASPAGLVRVFSAPPAAPFEPVPLATLLDQL